MPSKSITDLFSEFESRNKQKKFLNRKKISENEKIALIENEKRLLLLEKLQAELAGKNSATLNEQILKYERDADAIIQNEIRLHAINCPKCQDTGIHNGKYCNCFLEQAYQSIFGAANIDEFEETFENYDESIFDDQIKLEGLNDKSQRAYMSLIKKACEDFILSFPETGKRNLLLTGKTGLGKTYLLRSIAKKAKERGINTMLIEAGVLFHDFHMHRLGEELPLEYLYNADLLLIDDLGTETRTKNVTLEYLFLLLDNRQRLKKHTVIATNLMSQDIVKNYDERIASRIESKNDSLKIVFKGRDLRV